MTKQRIAAARNRLTRRHVLQVIRSIRRDEVPENRRPRGYVLVHGGDRFPPKYVLERAMVLAGGGPIDPEEHSGGARTNDTLTRLGFTVERLGSAVRDASPSSASRTRSSRRSRSVGEGPVVATVVIQNESGGPPERAARIRETGTIVAAITKHLRGPVVAVLPGGWVCSDPGQHHSVRDLVRPVVRLLRQNPQLVLVMGVDGPDGRKRRVHQRAAAISSAGVLAIGRKVFPVSDEAEYLRAADAWDAVEEGLPRVFDFDGRRFFLAVCYDVFGIKKQRPVNPGADAILNTVHGFSPKGESGSGETLFTRHGFAGASLTWGVPVFASAVFSNRRIPEDWPSGVRWKGRRTSTMKWSYGKNGIEPEDAVEVELAEGQAGVRFFRPWGGGRR